MSESPRWLDETPKDYFATRRGHAELMFRRIGITFNVYGDKDATERLIPFDIIPRVIQRSEWSKLEDGLVQRVTAINRFLADVYGKQEIIKAGIVPIEMITGNPAFRPEMMGQKVPHDIHVQIAGIDVVRVDDKDFYVLEDNVRTPSGVSYMLENREVMMRGRARPVRRPPRRPGRELSRRAPRRAAVGQSDGLGRSDDRGPHAGGRSIRPITSIRSWPTSSGSNSSKAATSSSRTTRSTCAPRRDRSAST